MNQKLSLILLFCRSWSCLHQCHPDHLHCSSRQMLRGHSWPPHQPRHHQGGHAGRPLRSRRGSRWPGYPAIYEQVGNITTEGGIRLDDSENIYREKLLVVTRGFFTGFLFFTNIAALRFLPLGDVFTIFTARSVFCIILPSLIICTAKSKHLGKLKDD